MKQKDLQNHSDEELLEMFKKEHNQEILACLFQRYSGLLYGVSLKYLENTEKAKDAVVDIYEYLVKKLPSQDILNFKSWLYVVGKNHCLMELRKSNKINIKHIDDFTVMQNEQIWHLDTEMQEKEHKLNKLEQCIKKLSEAQSQVVVLFYYEKKCYEQITEITGFDWNKVRSLIQNGRRNLKTCIDN